MVERTYGGRNFLYGMRLVTNLWVKPGEFFESVAPYAIIISRIILLTANSYYFISQSIIIRLSIAEK